MRGALARTVLDLGLAVDHQVRLGVGQAQRVPACVRGHLAVADLRVGSGQVLRRKPCGGKVRMGKEGAREAPESQLGIGLGLGLGLGLGSGLPNPNTLTPTKVWCERRARRTLSSRVSLFQMTVER